MPHTNRRFLVALLIALHAALTLCGPGHHGFAAPWSHAPEPIKASDPVGTIAESDCRSVDHCPVCDYLSQSQLPVESVRQTPGDRVEMRDRRDYPSHRLIPSHCPSIPRAPPAQA